MSTVASVSNGGCASARTAPAGGSVSRFACTPQAVLAQRQAINRDVVASAAPEESNQLKIFVDVAKKSTAALAAAITIGLSEPAFGADQALRLPISGNKEIAQVQEVMLETWSVVGDAFFDSSALNRVDWPQMLVKAMTRASNAEDYDGAFVEISSMLDTLGDPYTRIIGPRDYVDYRESADGELQGVGLLLSSDSRSRQVVVAAPLADSPAQRAGLRRGDVLVAIDGQPLPADADSGEASRRLRGASGTRVSVSFNRFPGGYTPGVPSRPPDNRGSTPISSSAGGLAASSAPELQTVTLERARVNVSPVAASKVTFKGQPIGYIRLSQFNAAAALDMQAAVEDLLEEGVKGFVLDLRDNPGGMVNVGLDIAHMWIPGGTPAFAVAGRDASAERTIILPPGPAMTDAPLTVLVNENSASASEILAGALHDSGRARIIGDNSTYGKGRIQAVFDLDDGSALFVTVAKYQTPSHADIDQRGIKPNSKCSVPAVRVGEESDVPISIRAVGVWQDEPLEELLFSDSCFMTASKTLAAQLAQPQSLPRLPSLPPFLADTNTSARR